MLILGLLMTIGFCLADDDRSWTTDEGVQIEIIKKIGGKSILDF